MANILFAKALNDRMQLETDGKILSFSLHPGSIITNLGRYAM